MQYGGMSDKPHYFTFSPDIAIDPNSSLPTGFSGIAYSGGVVPDYWNNGIFFGDCAIDMASVKIPDRMFALINHDDDERPDIAKSGLKAMRSALLGISQKRLKPGGL